MALPRRSGSFFPGARGSAESAPKGGKRQSSSGHYPSSDGEDFAESAIQQSANQSNIGGHRRNLSGVDRPRTYTSYRAYLLDSAGRFADVVPLECADDDEAMKQAQQLANGRDVELWQRTRKIAKFNGQSRDEPRK